MAMDTRTDDEKVEDILALFHFLENKRYDYENMVENIFQYVYPGRRKISDRENSAKGQKTGTDVFDNTALFALNTLVDGMVGYLCSRNQRWFRFTVPGNFNFPRFSGMRGWTGRPIDSYPAVRQWLRDCEDCQYAALNRSNFYDQVAEFLRDGAGVGTAYAHIEEDLGSGRIIFLIPHFRECYIAEDKFGRVDTHFRRYMLTLKQLAEDFGEDKMESADPGFKDRLKSAPYEEKYVLHAIYPRKDPDLTKWDSKNAPIASMWVLMDKKALLRESGYRWMPTVTWRWRKNNDEVYGRSPAWDAIVDILLANEQGRSNIVGSHKMVEPPMKGPKTLRGLMNTGPKSWTYVENEFELKAIEPMITVANLPFAVDAQQRTAENIKNHFGEPFFNILTQAALEKVTLSPEQIVQITGERAAILSTRVGMIESEALTPSHDRVFEIEARAGRMPQPPEILMYAMGAEMRIEYLGVLAQVQQMMTEIKAHQMFLGLVGQVAQYWPPAMDRIDGDKLVERYARMTNFPQDCMSSEERTEGIRAARAKMQEQQQKLEAMEPTAKLLRAAGPKPEPGSPASKLLNPEDNRGQK